MSTQSITMRAAPAMCGAKMPSKATVTTPKAAPRHAVRALAAAIDSLTFDGAKSGSATLELKTARAEVAKGLVHKYVVMVRQNARRVRVCVCARVRERTIIDGARNPENMTMTMMTMMMIRLEGATRVHDRGRLSMRVVSFASLSFASSSRGRPRAVATSSRGVWHGHA